jgi:hypothetical protein
MTNPISTTLTDVTGMTQSASEIGDRVAFMDAEFKVQDLAIGTDGLDHVIPHCLALRDLPCGEQDAEATLQQRSCDHLFEQIEGQLP